LEPLLPPFRFSGKPSNTPNIARAEFWHCQNPGLHGLRDPTFIRLFPSCRVYCLGWALLVSWWVGHLSTLPDQKSPRTVQ
jgi:hypothetical protein